MQIADFEKELSANPENVCVRGYLIAHGQDHVPSRMDHVLWMIEHHPEWDGFMINLSAASYKRELGAQERIRAAWLEQIGPNQQSGTVLHHASIFFEWRDPELAEELLHRAIRREPEVPFHVEGLGILYGEQVYRSRNPLFAAHARSKLLSSTEWLILAIASRCLARDAAIHQGR